MQEIFDEVLAEIVPKNPVEKSVMGIIEEIQKHTEAKVQLGGSLAKNTYLKSSHDVDIFVKYSYDKKDEDLSALLEQSLKETPYNFEKMHGSRDYFNAKINDFDVEVVPVLDIDDWSKVKNVTDMSPLHVTWVKDNIKDTTLANDIRLAKQFCKAQRVYGAESYIGGFSGHVLDILVIFYGGFRNFLSESQKWEEQEVIDVQGHFDGKNAMDLLNESKTQSPLVVVDPIDPQRNAASALTKERWLKFVLAAKAFLKEPKRVFFDEMPLTKDAFANKAIQIDLVPLGGKKDVVGAKCKKVYEHILAQCAQYDFVVEDSDWEFTQTKAKLFYVIIVTELPETKKILGPPKKMKEACIEFQKAHKSVFEEHDVLVAEEKRDITQLQQLLEVIKKSEYVLERVKNIKIIG